MSSQCAPCKQSKELHINRHREIAELLRQLEELQAKQDEEKTPAKAPEFARKYSNACAPSGMTKKERKAANKAAKRAAERPKVITTAQVEFVAQALHPHIDDEVNGVAEEARLLEDPYIKLNLYYHRGTSNTREVRYRHLSRKNSDQDDHIINADEMDALVTALKLPKIEDVKTEAERKIIVQVRKLVRDDMIVEHHENEETAMRKAGR
jgi:hypothetical protein